MIHKNVEYKQTIQENPSYQKKDTILFFFFTHDLPLFIKKKKKKKNFPTY